MTPDQLEVILGHLDKALAESQVFSGRLRWGSMNLFTVLNAKERDLLCCEYHGIYDDVTWCADGIHVANALEDKSILYTVIFMPVRLQDLM